MAASTHFFKNQTSTIRWNELHDADYYELIMRVPETGKWRFLTRRLGEARFTDEKPLSDRFNLYRIRAVTSTEPGALEQDCCCGEVTQRFAPGLKVQEHSL